MAYSRINITLPKETLEKLKKAAKEENRNLSNMVAQMIEQYKKQK